MFGRKSEDTGTVGKNRPGWFERSPQTLARYWQFADVFNKVGDEAIAAETSVRSRKDIRRWMPFATLCGRLLIKFERDRAFLGETL